MSANLAGLDLSGIDMSTVLETDRGAASLPISSLPSLSPEHTWFKCVLLSGGQGAAI